MPDKILKCSTLGYNISWGTSLNLALINDFILDDLIELKESKEDVLSIGLIKDIKAIENLERVYFIYKNFLIGCIMTDDSFQTDRIKYLTSLGMFIDYRIESIYMIKDTDLEILSIIGFNNILPKEVNNLIIQNNIQQIA
jgi:hypothetical protein